FRKSRQLSKVSKLPKNLRRGRFSFPAQNFNCPRSAIGVIIYCLFTLKPLQTFGLTENL
ncbi:unnamed protein product, partial [Amoebophrya sp. A120]